MFKNSPFAQTRRAKIVFVDLIYFSKRNPAGGAVFTHHLVNTLSLCPKGCQVGTRAICGDGSQQAGLLGEDSSLCLLAGHLQFSWRLALAPGQVLASF